MVASFPDDTVPFTPASRWRGGRVGRKGYRHADSKLSVVVVASEDQGHLPVVNPASLFPRLASWYLSVAPEAATDEAHLASTGIPLHYFHSAPAAEMQAFPEEWRFWKSRQPPPVGLPYAGGEGDSYRIDGLTPCADIIRSDPLLSLMGALPVSFDAFLTFLGHKAGGLRPVRNKVRDLMSTYLKCAWISFTTREREHRLGRGKGEARDTDGALGGDVGMDAYLCNSRPLDDFAGGVLALLGYGPRSDESLSQERCEVCSSAEVLCGCLKPPFCFLTSSVDNASTGRFPGAPTFSPSSVCEEPSLPLSPVSSLLDKSELIG